MAKSTVGYCKPVDILIFNRIKRLYKPVSVRRKLFAFFSVSGPIHSRQQCLHVTYVCWPCFTRKVDKDKLRQPLASAPLRVGAQSVPAMLAWPELLISVALLNTTNPANQDQEKKYTWPEHYSRFLCSSIATDHSSKDHITKWHRWESTLTGILARGYPDKLGIIILLLEIINQ